MEMIVKMKVDDNDFRALWLEDNTIKFIDQRKLPFKFEIYTAKNIIDVAFAIKDMVVRGAPAIGAAAAYGMALSNDIDKSAKILKETRPTASDLFFAVNYMLDKIKNGEDGYKAANDYVEDIINRCKKIGENGAALIKNGMKILTHCNAGALATVDYGTALAPFRIALKNNINFFVFVDETRPRLQGLLTAWELKNEGINHSIITDNAAGYFMKNKEVDMVITGADRIAKNGDFANKIGTYEKAVLAKENDIPFYVAAPVSTFDNTIPNGNLIIIEERKKNELTHIYEKEIMPQWVDVKNPAFDVTPSKYVTKYITEYGIK